MVGARTASLGELFCERGSQGVRVPNGFAFAFCACYDTLQSINAWTALHAAWDDLDDADDELLARPAAQARRIVYNAIGSEALRQGTLRASISSVDKRETVRAVAWYAARVAGTEHQLVVRP